MVPVAIQELTTAELGAWRGLLRVHSALVKALDAELLAEHDLPLTDLRAGRQRLEDVFLRLTEEGRSGEGTDAEEEAPSR